VIEASQKIFVPRGAHFNSLAESKASLCHNQSVKARQTAVSATLVPKLRNKRLLVFFGVVVGSFLFSVVGIVLILSAIFRTTTQTLQSNQISLGELTLTLRQGWQTPPTQSAGKVTFLFLGTDEVANRNNQIILTDTIMLASLDLDSAKIRLLSLPRDLWHEEYQTKINALYHYGSERDPQRPYDFPQAVVSELIDAPIHHVVVISLASLGELIDTVGGVTGNIEADFTDTQFPRDDVDITSSDPAVLYETVSFSKGEEHMDSTRALKYIRSRKSSSDQGTDTARSVRQQQVILALADRLRSPEVLLNPSKLIALYQWYQTHINPYLPFSESISIGKAILPDVSGLEFVSTSLTEYPDDPGGVITHPPQTVNRYQNQWVYVIPDLAAFQKYVKEALVIDNHIDNVIDNVQEPPATTSSEKG